MNREGGVGPILLDVKPGTRFPPTIRAQSVVRQRLYLWPPDGPGDFSHADGGTDHGSCGPTGSAVLLVVPPEDYMRIHFLSNSKL